MPASHLDTLRWKGHHRGSRHFPNLGGVHPRDAQGHCGATRVWDSTVAELDQQDGIFPSWRTCCRMAVLARPRISRDGPRRVISRIERKRTGGGRPPCSQARA